MQSQSDPPSPQPNAKPNGQPNPGSPSLTDRVIDRIIAILEHRKAPDSILRRTFLATRILLLVVNLAYLAALIVILAAMEWVGERNWIISTLLFLPPVGWLLPLGLLTPATLLLHARQTAIHAVAVVLVLFVYMDYNLGSPTDLPADRTVTVVTANIGETNRQSIKPFIDAEVPDIIVMQDAKGRERRYRERYSQRHVAACGEFIIASRFPVVASAPVALPRPDAPDHTVAATFDIRCHGQLVRLYNVHLPTPRRDLGRVCGIGFLKELLRPYLRPDHTGWTYRAALRERTRLATALADRIAEETLPVIVAGDLNHPDHGYVYRQYVRRLQDAFEERGRGYGYTFPGTTRNPLSLFGPWLRIDYILCCDRWEVQYSRTEPDRESQHRAVVARLRLK